MPEITTSHGGELEEDWYPELEELPQRPRRKLVTPATVALALVLFAACGFIGGVLVQKGQASGTPTAGGGAVASRFGAAASGASGASGTAGFASRFAGLFGGAGGGASGTVSSISGSTLYVTETSGNTVAVVTTPESKITKSESVKNSAIHPGDSIVVEGITGSSGTITASSVTDSGNSGTSSSSATSSSGVSSLFGSR
jgi:preprotein translocase subunit SecG